MELRCAIACSLVSLVIATPHGYGAKGGAAAKAEAGAVASAFSGLSGLPLSIPDGTGAISGSFSKSSSSSFASSSASSSSGSFSFSGSGANGLSGYLGLPGNGGCKTGGCQSGSGINFSQGTSSGNNIPSYSGAHAAAEAGALAGVQNGAGVPCSGNNCSDQKSPCEGKDCKDFGDISNNASKKCSSGQCNIKSDSSSSAAPSNTGDICAKGQCGVNQPTGATGFSDDKKCSLGNCAPNTGKPSDNYGLNDIPGDIAGSPSLTSNIQSSDNDKTKNDDVDCSHGNCPNKPNSEHPDSSSPASTIVPGNSPAHHTSPSSGSFPNNNNVPFQNAFPKHQQPTCIGRYCDNKSASEAVTNIQGSAAADFSVSSSKSKTPTYSEVPDSSDKCISGNCGSHSSQPSNFDSSGLGFKPPSYSPGFSSSDSPNCALGNCGPHATGPYPSSDYSKSKTPTHPGSVPNSPGNCASGNCASSPSFQPSIHDNSGSEPSTLNHYHSIPSGGSPNCASGNCGTYPSNQYPSLDSSGPKSPTQSKGSSGSPSNCVSGNCASSRPEPATTEPKSPTYSSGTSSSGSPNCAFGNCGSYPSSQYPGYDTSRPKNPIHQTELPGSPSKCTSGNCASSQPGHDFSITGPKTPTYSSGISSSGSPNCAFGSCGSYPSSQQPGSDTFGPKNPTNPTEVSDSSTNCASGNCPSPPSGHGFSTTGPKSPIYFPNTPTSGSPNCAFGNCGSYPPSKHPGSDTFGPKNPTNPTEVSGSPPNCASGNCLSSPSGPGTTGPKSPTYSPSTSTSGAPNCAFGNCGSYPSGQHSSFDTSRPTISTHLEAPISSTSCTYGNCAKVPSTGSNGYSSTDTKYPSAPQPSTQYPAFNPSGSKSPTYDGGSPGITSCAFGNCANVPGHTRPKIPNNTQGTPSSGSSNCASGNCDTSPYPGFDTSGGRPSNCASGNCANNPPSTSTAFSSTGHKLPSYLQIPSSGSANCASGNCGSYPSGQYPGFDTSAPPSYLSESTGSKFPEHSKESSPNPTNCASGNCNIHSSQPVGAQTGSNVPSQPTESFPAFIPLAPTKPTSTHGIINSAGSAISNSGVVGGVHSSSSIYDTSKPSTMGEIYTGGFGGPPGILKPYEFKPPSPGGYYSTISNKPDLPSPTPPCASGTCAAQPGHSNSNSINNSAETLGTNSPASCASGKCDTHTNSNYGQNGVHTNTAIASSASIASGAVYTGGFGGPPGILKPYDGGKIPSGAGNIFGKVSISSQSGPDASHYEHGTASNKLNGFGVHAGAAALASADTYSSGNRAGDNKGVGGCGGGCGSTGSGSLGGNHGWSDGLQLPKTAFSAGLDAAGAVAKSIAGAISSAGANTFAHGGSFASNSAHATSGAVAKGGYGR